MRKRAQGFTDEAAQQDLFEIKKYINGLEKFIETCNTPMTISIQGAWGTGKTSIMQIISNMLEERGKTLSVWFNTWQFSQFSMDSELAISLLSCLLEELSVSEEQKEKVTKTTQAIRFAQAMGRMGKEVALSVIDSTFGGRVAENVEKGINGVQETLTERTSPATAIKNLRKQFSQCVSESLERTGKDRVVIFIDDLDRLEPRKAVELLEVLKLFLDCKNCVFILAIDYDVVCKGVSSKYGENMSEKKGRNFFEKIIQVPFKMPVAEYNIKNYVANCFKEIGVPCPESDLGIYIELIKRSIGTNPRSMKRLFNAYLLLTMVVSEEILENDRNKKLLFAILCLQHSFEKTYDFIVASRDILTADKIRLLAEGTKQELEERLENVKLDDDEINNMQPFMEQLLQMLGTDNDDEISGTEIESFKNILGISTITSSREENKPVRKSVEVSDIKELQLEGKDKTTLEAMIAKIQAIGKDITYSMRNNKNVHVLFKNGQEKSFADIYMRKVGVSVDCIASSKDTFTNPEVIQILRKYGKVLNKMERSVSLRVNDAETEKDCLTMIKICYDSYREKQDDGILG